MNIPVQRRNQHAEPVWCATTDHTTVARGRMHKSRDVSVGVRPGGGVVSARLLQPVGGQTVVAVTACDVTSVTAEISVEDATRLRGLLDVLIEQAQR